jgi:MFS family permease
MNAGALRRSMRLSIAEGALATSMATLLSGVFLTGFALSLGASKLEIGLLAALPFLSNVAQLGGAYVLERTGQRKWLCVGSLLLSRLVWLPVLATPLMPAEWRWLMAPLLLVIVGTSSVLSGIGGVAWLSWIRDLVPQAQRIRFLATRNQFDSALALTLSIAGAAFADAWLARWPGTQGGFASVFMTALACGFVGIRLLSAIPDENPPADRESGVLDLMSAPLRDANFRRLLSYFSAWQLAVNLAAPFFAVYLLETLRLPLWKVTALHALGSIVGLAANRFWSRLGERFGAKPVLLVASFGEALYPALWLFIVPGTEWALPAVFAFTGLFSSPIATGGHNLVLGVVPERNASPFMATFSAVTGPMAAGAAVLGGLLATTLGSDATLGPLPLNGLQIVFALSMVVRLGSLFLLGRVREPGASSVRVMLSRVTERRAVPPATIKLEVVEPTPAPTRIAA